MSWVRCRESELGACILCASIGHDFVPNCLREVGFPPIREIKEFRKNLKPFSSQENQGKQGFPASIRGENLREKSLKADVRNFKDCCVKLEDKGTWGILWDTAGYCRKFVWNIFCFPEMLVTLKNQKMPNYTNTWGHQTAEITLDRSCKFRAVTCLRAISLLPAQKNLITIVAPKCLSPLNHFVSKVEKLCRSIKVIGCKA